MSKNLLPNSVNDPVSIVLKAYIQIIINLFQIKFVSIVFQFCLKTLHFSLTYNNKRTF